MPKTIYTEIYNPNGNLLFTLEQLNNASVDDMCLPVRCMKCGKTFHISRRMYQAFVRYHLHSGRRTNELKICSRNCTGNCNEQQDTNLVTKPCLFCGKLVTKCRSEASKYPNFFCCHSHAASYNNSHRAPRSEESRAKTSATIRAQRPKRPPKPCKVCGQYPCAHTEPCKGNWLRREDNIKRLESMGFDISTLGTPQIVDSYNAFRIRFLKLYVEDEMSQNDLTKMFNLPCALTMSLLFKWLQIPVLNKHDQGVRTMSKMQEIEPFVSDKYCYKHGHHTTWFNTDVFYRSSYELDYCLELDRQKIKYDMEALRIRYWDSVQQKERVAIPDFYLPETNTIVEVKGDFTYDKQNMIDRSDQYKKLGYNFKLILEHQEYTNCP